MQNTDELHEGGTFHKSGNLCVFFIQWVPYPKISQDFRILIVVYLILT
jgi:hypothetical protein